MQTTLRFAALPAPRLGPRAALRCPRGLAPSLALCLLLAPVAWAQDRVAGPAASTPAMNHLPEVEVSGPRDAAIGVADSASEGAVERESFRTRPKLRPGDIVEAVPGV